MKFFTRVLVLALLWAALWGNLRPQTIAGGLVVGAAVALFWRIPVRPDTEASPPVFFHPIRAGVYFIVFLALLIRSTVDLAIQTVMPRPRITQAIVGCPLRTDSDLIATIVANTISMTPGTLTVEITGCPRVLFVHTLRYKKPDDLHDTVRLLEDLATKALRPLGRETVE